MRKSIAAAVVFLSVSLVAASPFYNVPNGLVGAISGYLFTPEKVTAAIPQPEALTTTELFISEYLEGSSNNKAIEIYNDTGAAVDLTAGVYSIQFFFNGATTAGGTIALTGTVANGDVYVVATTTSNAAILAQADQTSAAAFFNGDDAVTLRKNGVVIDSIGQIGTDPGTEWGTGLVSTADNTITRKSTVCVGDTNTADTFDPSIEWNGFAVDTTTGLGAHSATCTVNQPPTVDPITRTVAVGTASVVTDLDLFYSDPEGNAISAVTGISVSGGPASAVANYNGTTHEITLTPSNPGLATTAANPYVVSFTVSDNGTPSASTTSTIAIYYQDPPAVTTLAATNIGTTTATLNGTATNQVLAATITARLRYSSVDGTCNDSFGTRAPSSGSSTIGVGGAFAENITGLTPATTYYFCAVASNIPGGPNTIGAKLSFTTGLPSYRSAASGLWSDLSTWEVSTDGGGTWAAASTTPTSGNADTITVRNGHIVTIATSVAYDQLTVDSGGQITVASGVTHTLAAGSGTDLVINGTWLNEGSAWAVTGATWSLGAGGTFVHSGTSALHTPLTVATLDPASNFVYKATATVPDPLISLNNLTFGNLTFDSTNGWTAIGQNGSNLTVNGNFLVTSSVALTNRLTGNVQFGGNFTINGSYTIGLTSFPTHIFVGAGKTISNNSPLTFTNLNINAGASIVMTGTVLFQSGFAYNINGGLTVSGLLDTADSALVGTGSFTLGDDAFLEIGTAAGLSSTPSSGTIQVTGTRDFSTAGRYVYDGSTNQTVGDQLPSTVQDLSIENSGLSPNNTVTGNSGQVVTGTLNVFQGVYSGASTYNAVGINTGAEYIANGPLSVSGNWSNNGTFTANGNTVTFNGANQFIFGSTTFYNFSKIVAAADVLTFDSLGTQTITNSLTLNGAVGNLLSLRSISTGNQWHIVAPASQSVSFVDVRDSNASGGQTIAQTNSIDSGNNVNWNFVILVAPSVTTNASSLVTINSATLNGTANPNGAATTGWFRYATTSPGTCNDSFGTRAPAAGGSALGSGTANVPYGQAITGLSAGTTYYVCAIAQNSVGTGFGTVVPFTTAGSAPSATTSAATLVTSTTATLNGSGDPNDVDATGWFRYSTTNPVTCNDSFGTRAPSSGGSALGSGTSPVAYSQPITGLAANSTYYFCAIVQNSLGTAFGSVLSFNTPTNIPAVTTNAASPVAATTATLNGTATPNGAATTGWFRYASVSPGTCNDSFGTRAPAAGGTSLGAGTSGVPYSQAIAGLTPSTTYYFCAIAQNENATSFGAVLQFTTPSSDATPPAISYTPLINIPGVSDQSFSVTATDAVGVTSVNVSWQNNDSGTPSVNACTSNGGTPQNGTWTCTILAASGSPAQTSPGSVTYFVSASDAAGNSTSNPTGSVRHLFTVGNFGFIDTTQHNVFDTVQIGSGFTFNGNATINTAITIDGNLDMGANKLTIECSAGIFGTSQFAYIIGAVEKIFCGAQTFTFPVGTVTNGTLAETPEGDIPVVPEYSPFTATVVGGTVGSSLTVKANDGTMPGVYSLQSISRWWDVTENGNLTANITFQYLQEDVVGPNEAAFKVIKRDAFSTYYPNGSVNAAANTGSASNVSEFSGWSAGFLIPTAANVSLKGRIVDANGRGISNVTLEVKDVLGTTVGIARSSSFGFYSVEGLVVGETYVTSVGSKRYVFDPASRVVVMEDNVDGFDFTALPIKH